ncbi:MAG: hypothetical protein JWP97_4054 [Labilithrix sp.]|nr:hypothetical protein [Labilithrix sp.]
MIDREAAAVVVEFERGTIDAARFGHREHLRVAFGYLQVLSQEEALARYVRHLRALVAALGAPEKFHATMTWAYVLLVSDAMERAPGATFDELMDMNPALLDHRAGALHELYDRAQLDAAEARRRFVLPRRR